MMFCVRNLRRNCVSLPARLVTKAEYSRRSSDDVRTCIVNYNQESFKNFDNAVAEYDPNWELLMPAGYRFYLPGSVGHGWADAASTIRMEFNSTLIPASEEISPEMKPNRKGRNTTTVFCEAKECPKLLRKDIKELFPAWIEVMFPEMSIVTIIQKPKERTVRWSKEMEVEHLAKSFVLSASYVCSQLRLARHWADFINPFSGRPHVGQKRNDMYAQSEHGKSLDFEIEDKNNCKIISQYKSNNNFIGTLYTTAPPDSALLQELMNDVSLR